MLHITNNGYFTIMTGRRLNISFKKFINLKKKKKKKMIWSVKHVCVLHLSNNNNHNNDNRKLRKKNNKKQ